MPLPEKSPFADLRDQLAATAAFSLVTPLPALSDEVEQAAQAECREILIRHIEKMYGVDFKAIRALPGVIGFKLGSMTVHLTQEVVQSQDGFLLKFILRQSPHGPATDLEDVFIVKINGVGRISDIVFQKDVTLPYTSISAGGGRSIDLELQHVAEGWYSSLEAYAKRLMRQLTSEVVDDMLIEVRRVVPSPYSDSVWLYAIINDYGFSLTDAIARSNIISTIQKQRGQLDASPLEAAISLIAVEMERDRSFSTEVISRGMQTEIPLQKTKYSGLVQDTEFKLYGTDTVTAMLLASSPNKEIGVVAAFPKSKAGIQIIAPRLQDHRNAFQALLDKLGFELRSMMGSVDRLTKLTSPRSERTALIVSPTTPTPSIESNRDFRIGQVIRW